MKLNRFDASEVFKARCRMFDVKRNFKGKYRNLKCRLCKQKEETQDHIFFECSHNKIDREKKFTIEDLFQNDNLDKLKQVARTLSKVSKLLEETQL